MIETKHIRPLHPLPETELPPLDENARLVLRPDLRMRREPHFVSLWRLGDDAGAHDVNRLHPATAILLGLFDGQRSVGDVIRAFSRVMAIPEDEARTSLVNFVDGHPGWLSPGDESTEHNGRRSTPESFVIPANDVDLQARPGAPYSLVFCMTVECVADCVYCYAERGNDGQHRKLLPLGRVIDLLDEVVDLQMPGMVVSGGDPFTHPNVIEILRAMVNRGIFVAPSTKCELSEATVGALADMGLPRLQVSIDTADERIHEFLTRAPGLLSGTLNTAKRASAAGIRVLANAVLTSHNVEGMSELAERLAAMGVRSLTFSEYNRSLYRHSDDLFVRPDQLAQAAETVQRLNSSFEMSIELSTRPNPPFEDRAVCTAGIQQLAVYADGIVAPCDTAPSTGPTAIGDLTRQSLKEVWDSESLLSLRYPSRERFAGTVCETCEDFDACHQGKGRCFIKSLQAYGRIFAPTPECPRAPTPSVSLQASDLSIMAAVRRTRNGNADADERR